jgi:hypothetical protein
MRNWEYSPLVARTELVRLIARLDIPISLGDSDAFVEYITNAHNPNINLSLGKPPSETLPSTSLIKRLNLLNHLPLLVLIVCA